MVKKVTVALVTVAFIQALLALCIVSALQLLVPRDTPFGVVGSSQVVSQVKKTTSLDTMKYPDQSAAINAINQGHLYGAFIVGSHLHLGTLVVVPAKSFFARVELEQAFVSAGAKLKIPFRVEALKPLPQSDNIGAVVTLLLMPLLIGGYLAAVLVRKAAADAAAPWRALILTGYAIVGALLTDLIVGPLIGAYSSSHFWPLLPCFALVTTAVVLAAAAIQALVGRLGSLVVVILLLIVGGSSAGGLGITLLPVYWQDIGAVFPPRNAVELIRNVLYFGGNNITTPLIVLFLYALAGAAVIGYLGWARPAQTAVAASSSAKLAAAPAPAMRLPEPVAASAPLSSDPGSGPAPGSAPAPSSPRSKKALSKQVLLALVVVAIMQCLFSFNYMDAGHEAVATNMPFGVTGSSPVLTQVEKTFSLRVTHYPDESAAKQAIGQAKIWGALIPGTVVSTLIVVPSISDLAPLDLAANFEKAAITQRRLLKVQQYTPVPLAKKDPFGLVLSLMLLPLLVGGYVCSTLLRGATGEASGRWRGMILAGFAVGAGLVVDLIVGLWLQGYPTGSFWIVWPIASLIIIVTALVAAVLQKLLGAAGTLLTTIVVMLFGNPSSGGANGVPYLPTFWRDIGPFLPPRNAYILLRNSVYFHGNGTTQALVVLLIYAGVGALALGFLDWYRSPAPSVVTPETEGEAVTMVIPIGAP
jgi:hypothetical protein